MEKRLETEIVSDTIDFYLARCIKSLDEKFGNNYAKENPALIGIYIQSCVNFVSNDKIDLRDEELIPALERLSQLLSKLKLGTTSQHSTLRTHGE
ncbi:hypothetical protein [Flavipsychrobacter stenotrophus]|nr:hypothetical protein [Flavipsychrobacter stenotrophus]